MAQAKEREWTLEAGNTPQLTTRKKLSQNHKELNSPNSPNERETDSLRASRKEHKTAKTLISVQ